MDDKDPPPPPVSGLDTAREAALGGLRPEQFDELKRDGSVPDDAAEELEEEVDASIGGVQGEAEGGR